MPLQPQRGGVEKSAMLENLVHARDLGQWHSIVAFLTGILSARRARHSRIVMAGLPKDSTLRTWRTRGSWAKGRSPPHDTCAKTGSARATISSEAVRLIRK
jgi:hypothetical protein